jgi:hypothetical protein
LPCLQEVQAVRAPTAEFRSADSLAGRARPSLTMGQHLRLNTWTKTSARSRRWPGSARLLTALGMWSLRAMWLPEALAWCRACLLWALCASERDVKGRLTQEALAFKSGA